MDPAITQFLEERKAAALKSKVKANMSEVQKQEEIERIEKRYNLKDWLEEVAINCSKSLYLCSHPVKFSNPDVKQKMIGPVHVELPLKQDGFLKTGNCKVRHDFSCDAKVIPHFQFLTLQLEDGKSLFQHALEKSNEIQEILKEANGIDTEIFCNSIQKTTLSYLETSTDGKISQVYFPVDDGYHLLSILTASGLVFEMKSRINDIRYSEQSKEIRKLRRDNKFSDQYVDDIFDLTVIGYGGAHPKNISTLNQANHGEAFLLPSVPPDITPRVLKLPKTDFFQNTLWRPNFKESFHALHKIISVDYNNLNIRNARDNILNHIIDQILGEMWKIRSAAPGWSEEPYYTKLSQPQKIWLDEIHNEKRLQEELWLDTITTSISRWIITSYKKTMGKEAFVLADAELLHIKSLVITAKEGLL